MYGKIIRILMFVVKRKSSDGYTYDARIYLHSRKKKYQFFGK
jgi:hypothetical protein